MISACWLAIWIACSGFGMAVVYRTGLRIERWSRALGLAYLVLAGPSVPILAWLAADQIVAVEQASCEELDPGCSLRAERREIILAHDKSQMFKFCFVNPK